jgi:thiamine-phosphate pyrophosphorylase
MELRGFYFITDSGLSTKPDVEAVKAAVEGGCRVVQYREKRLPVREMLYAARKMREITSRRVFFLINDRVDVALVVDADGVHLGQEDMPLTYARRIMEGKIIGVTVHSVEEALAAQEDGADYVGVSPVFKTATKPDAGEPAGLQLIKDVKKTVDLPVAAIGGINEGNVDSVIEAGADMVCAISATVTKDDIKGAVEYFAEKFKK